MSVLETLFALEKLKKDDDERWIVYTYVVPDRKSGDPSEKDIPVTAMFILLDVCSNEKKAKKKAEEIIRQTGHSDILTYPFSTWLTLGDPNAEKVTPVEIRDQLGEHANKEEKRIAKLSKERRAVEKEISAEQKAIQDPTTIESYYYDWICAVQNRGAVTMYKEALDVAESAYMKRVNNIKEKNTKFPEHKSKWQDLLRERLARREENSEAEAIIEGSKEISRLEGLD